MGLAFDAPAAGLCDAESNPNGAYWRGFLAEGPEAFAPNLVARLGVLKAEGCAWPMAEHTDEGVQSYPCSLLTQYIRYPSAELGLVLSGVQRMAAHAGLHAAEGILQAVGLDRTVQWSSWLLSTNLHDPSLAVAAPGVTRLLCERFPSHAILVRNIHAFEDPTLPARLAACGYELWVSRRIYFFDGRDGGYMARSTVRRDVKAFASLRDYSVVEHSDFTGLDAARIAELYSRLYLEKHSTLNPQYTTRFVERALEGRWLEFCGLRHASGRLDGVFGCFSRGAVTSTPFIGYDTALPAETGLYRHLVSLLLSRVAQRGQLLNYSSGAGDFKRRRGGVPVLEYNAVYTKHLNPARRAALGAFGRLLNQVGRRFLEGHDL